MRLVQSLTFRERVQLLVGAILGLVVPSRLVRREMDHYAAAPEEFAATLRDTSPTIARVLLDERNEHMAERLVRLRREGYGRLAAVVGDAHVVGLAAALNRRGVPTETIPFARLRELTARRPSPP
jgi:pheromone shutdown protein TraB